MSHDRVRWEKRAQSGDRKYLTRVVEWEIVADLRPKATRIRISGWEKEYHSPQNETWLDLLKRSRDRRNLWARSLSLEWITAL